MQPRSNTATCNPTTAEEQQLSQDAVSSSVSQESVMKNFIDVMSSKQLKYELAAVTKERDDLLATNLQYKNVISAQRQQLQDLKKELDKHLSKSLSGVFSPCQVQKILYSTPIKSWAEDDIRKAITLRTLSPKAYRFLREKWHIPLPSPATISRWMSKFDAEPGILQSVINLMHHQSSFMPEYERLCAVSFDETYISGDWCYDKKK